MNQFHCASLSSQISNLMNKLHPTTHTPHIIHDLDTMVITPILWPVAEIYIQLFAASPDPIYQEISRRFVIAKDWNEYDDMVSKVISTGMYADMGTVPDADEEDYEDWYRSTEAIPGDYPYSVHLSNKKWPLKKVLYL